MTSLLTTIEREAIREGRPVLYAVLATALARWFGQPDTLGALMERAYLFTARERAVLARGIGQVRTIAELVGRAKTQANAAGIEFAKPDEAARKLNPARAFKLRPRKAMSYFKALSPARRIPLSKEWLDDHRREAFTMAEVTEATILKRVHKLIYDAIEEGDVTTRDFQVKLKDFGVTSKNPQYAEMVFRTNALDSYNKGYYDEVREDPDLREYFPYWEYLAVEDDRLSEEHAAHLRGGEGGGPYYPASRDFDSVRGDRVFNCRCTFRWVDKFEAEELGLMERLAPIGIPREAPVSREATPLPASSFRSKLVEAFGKRVRAEEKAISEQVRHATTARAKFIKSIEHRPPADVPSILQSKEYKKVKKEYQAAKKREKRLKRWAKETRDGMFVKDAPASIDVWGLHGKQESVIASATRRLQKLTSASCFPGGKTSVGAVSSEFVQRASYNPTTDIMDLSPSDRSKVFYHEFGHHLENKYKAARKAGQEFHRRRTKGQKLVDLREYNEGHRAGEKTIPDKFWHPYAGKLGGTEIVSMGLEAFMVDPKGFALADPEHFDLITRVLAGKA